MFDRPDRRPNPLTETIDDGETAQDTADPFARRARPQPKVKPEPARLSASVGDAGRNDRKDVAKVETMLGKTGDLDLKQTDGPTGYWGMRTSDATKAFQKKNKLRVDGQINPSGPTLKKLGEAVAAKLRTAQAKEASTFVTRHPRERGDQVAALDSRLRGSDDEGSGIRTNLTPDAVAANARAARYLASRRGIGDYPTFVAEGIEMNPEQGIAEAADLIEQTRAKSPEQADALLKKTLEGLSETNARRLREMMQDTDGSENLSIRIPRGKRSKPVPLPERPATPKEIDKALEKAGRDLERLSRNPDFLKTPIGQAIMGSRIHQQWLKQQAAPDARTDVAEPLPDREEFPAHERDPDDGKLAGETSAPGLPDREEFPPQDIDATVPGTPDQSDDPDINGATLLDMAAPGPRDFILTKDKKLNFGTIPAEVEKATGGRFPAKPIRVQRGEPGATGFGARHVESDKSKVKRIKALGYESEIEMIEDVSAEYTELYEQSNGRLFLVKPNGKERYAIIELQGALEGEYYGASTWFPDGHNEKSYLKRQIEKGRLRKIWP